MHREWAVVLWAQQVEHMADADCISHAGASVDYDLHTQTKMQAYKVQAGMAPDDMIVAAG